jgi:hypothetical protein
MAHDAVVPPEAAGSADRRGEVPRKAFGQACGCTCVKRKKFARNPIRFGLEAYLVSLVLVLLVAGIVSAFDGFSSSALAATLRDGSILLGISWIVIGFLLGSSVNAYLGPGSFGRRAPPMIWPAGAIPQRSPEVLNDLRTKLSDPQGLSLLFVVLGILVLLVGVLAYLSLTAGLLAMASLAAAVVVSLAVRTPRLKPSDAA